MEMFIAFLKAMPVDKKEYIMSEATIIAKILWYTGSLSLQTLAWILEISVNKVENLINSDAYLDAVVELIRTRPDRTGVSIEDWWENEWKHKPQRFSKRMRIPEAKISRILSKSQQIRENHK